MHMPSLPYFQRSLILLESLIDMLHTSTVLATTGLTLAGHHVFLVILQLAFGLVVHTTHLTQLVELCHSFLTHDCFC